MSPGPNREIHRPLQLMTPNLTGPDVEELQLSINALFKGWKLDNHVGVDGELGPQTKRKTNRALYLLGADPAGVGNAGPVFTQAEQKLIRSPESRGDEQLERSKRRVAEARHAQETHRAGAGAAVAAAMAKRGETEHPLGSNLGPFVEMVTRFCGLTPPVYWCGCFAAWCAISEGKADNPAWAMVHNVYMLNYARAGLYNLEAVPLSEAKAGDIVSYTFAHIGLIVEDYKGGNLHTVEGNTGETGQQNNGGGVYEHRDRGPGVVLGVIRPNYGKERKV